MLRVRLIENGQHSPGADFSYDERAHRVEYKDVLRQVVFLAFKPKRVDAFLAAWFLLSKKSAARAQISVRCSRARCDRCRSRRFATGQAIINETIRRII